VPTQMAHQPRPSYSSGYEEFHDSRTLPDSFKQGSASPEVPSIERGNKLLSFQQSIPGTTVLDYAMRPAPVSFQAQLHGMFFLAESSRVGPGSNEIMTGQPELTCYRRNLFQISGSVTVPRLMQYVVTEHGEQLPIASQELCISATESVEGTPVKIISVPWKTPVAGTAPPAPEDKTEKEPCSIPLDPTASHDVESEVSVLPIAWKRLQFRVATANNGRRKELQQHFIIKLSLVATLQSGSKVTVCHAFSGPIIVRGRSPRNFQQRKDLPLSNSGASARKSIVSISPTSIRRASTVDVIRHDRPSSTGTPEMSYSMAPSHSLGSYEWRHNSIASEAPTRNASLTAPVSPYIQPDSDTSRPTLKRKLSAEPPHGMRLSIPNDQETSNSQESRSAPPERPRKLPRVYSTSALPTTTFTPPQPYSHSFNPTLPSSSAGQQYSYNSSTPVSSAPQYEQTPQYHTSSDIKNEITQSPQTAEPPVYEYYPQHQHQHTGYHQSAWMQPMSGGADPYRQGIAAMPRLPVTSVGGSGTGLRRAFGDDGL
jgi:hypothetical protein